MTAATATASTTTRKRKVARKRKTAKADIVEDAPPVSAPAPDKAPKKLKPEKTAPPPEKEEAEEIPVGTKPKKRTKREKQKEKTAVYITKFGATVAEVLALLDELETTLDTGKVVYKGRIGSLRARTKALTSSHNVYFGLNRRTPREHGGLSSTRYISPKLAVFLGRKVNDEIRWRDWTSIFAAYMRENKLNVHTDKGEDGNVISGRWVRPDAKLNELFNNPGLFKYTHAQRLACPHLSKTPFGEDGIPLPAKEDC